MAQQEVVVMEHNIWQCYVKTDNVVFVGEGLLMTACNLIGFTMEFNFEHSTEKIRVISLSNFERENGKVFIFLGLKYRRGLNRIGKLLVKIDESCNWNGFNEMLKYF